MWKNNKNRKNRQMGEIVKMPGREEALDTLPTENTGMGVYDTKSLIFMRFQALCTKFRAMAKIGKNQ